MSESLVSIRIRFPAPGPHWVSGFGVRPIQASGFNVSPEVWIIHLFVRFDTWVLINSSMTIRSLEYRLLLNIVHHKSHFLPNLAVFFIP